LTPRAACAARRREAERRHRRPTLAFALAAALSPALALGQAAIRVNDTLYLRLGLQLQAWADFAQTSAASAGDGYAQNLELRRARFFLSGQASPDVSFYFLTDSPNLGAATGSASNPKGFTPGFRVQDAWVEWKLAEPFSIVAGEMYVPFSRNELTSSSSYLTLDGSPMSSAFSSPTQTNGQRDTGIEAKGYLAGGHLEYRAAAFQGARQTGSRNAPLLAGYVQYDFLDTEKGYTYAGTNLGKKSVLAFAAGYETQAAYRAHSAAAFATIPVRAGDELAGIAQWTHYDGAAYSPSLADQNDLLVELGYLVGAARLQPFAKIERQRFADPAFRPNDLSRWGGGFNYYLRGQSLKLTGALVRTDPRNPQLRRSNEATLQLQVYYF